MIVSDLNLSVWGLEGLRIISNLNTGNYEEMNEGTRKFLIEYFKPHNERLSKLLKRIFDWDK